VTGPSNGKRSVLYNYTVVSTDPDADEVYYFADWDDGSNSGWVGPYFSGETTVLSHAWTQSGSYVVKIKVKDTKNLESNWTTIDMMISGPVIEITIKGGVGINAAIKNTGTASATNITWTVFCDGGLIIPRQMTGKIDYIDVETTNFLRPLIFGLGRSTITVTVIADDGVNAEGVVNGFFLMLIVIGVK
jgi:hypothetical protein